MPIKKAKAKKKSVKKKSVARHRVSKPAVRPYVEPKTAAELGILCAAMVDGSKCGKPVLWFDYALGEKSHMVGFVCEAHKISNRVEKLEIHTHTTCGIMLASDEARIRKRVSEDSRAANIASWLTYRIITWIQEGKCYIDLENLR